MVSDYAIQTVLFNTVLVLKSVVFYIIFSCFNDSLESVPGVLSHKRRSTIQSFSVDVQCARLCDFLISPCAGRQRLTCDMQFSHIACDPVLS